jgi:hypothetical protein
MLTVLAASLALAAGVSPAAAPNSGIRGVVVYGGGPLPRHGAPRPPVTNVRITVRQRGRLVAMLTKEPKGRFRVALRPGVYRVVGTLSGRLCQALRLTVHPGSFVPVRLGCNVR